MFVSAARRLYYALLFEMASGSYSSHERFLSHRLIMRNWRVSATTANLALELLQHDGIIYVRDRSGHYLAEDFRDKTFALLGSGRCDADPLPIARGGNLRNRLIGAKERGGSDAMRIGVLLVTSLSIPKGSPRGPSGLKLDVAAALTARGVYLLAEENKNHVDFVVCSAAREDQLRPLAHRLSHTAPDGVIIICRNVDQPLSEIAEGFLSKLIPVVAVFDDSERTGMISVDFNNIATGIKAAEILRDAGHRRFALLAHRIKNRWSDDRIKGFLKVLEGEPESPVAQFTIDPEAPCDHDAIADAIIQSGATAIYSAGYEILAPLLSIFAARGISIPGNLSVLASSSTPDFDAPPRAISILHLDFESLGKIAYRALSDYRCGDVSQKCYVVNTPYRDYGTVGLAVEP